MIRLETYKIFKRKIVWLVLTGIILLVCIPGAAYLKNYLLDKNQSKILQYQIEKYESNKGILTDERLSKFVEQYVPEEYDYISNFTDGERAAKIQEIFPEIDFDIHFGYFKLWSFFLDDLPKYIKYITIFIVISFSAIFTYEKDCGMQEILLSTSKGRYDSIKAKVVSSFIITNILFMVIVVLACIPLLILTKGVGFDTSIQMTPWLMDCQMNINNLTLSVHMIFLSFVAVNLILLITLCASFVSKSPTVAMCISLGVLFVLRPDIISANVNNEIVNRITAMTPLNVIDSVNLAKQLPIAIAGYKIEWLILTEVVYVLMLIGGFVFFFKVLSKYQKYYAS